MPKPSSNPQSSILNPQAFGLFVSGTDTGVGKTYVAALVARALAASGLRVGVYKPVASGCRREGNDLISEDALALWEAAGRPGTLEHVCPQRFVAPLAPHLAARAEGCRVDAERLRGGLEFWRQRSDIVVVEGVGGLMSPVSDEDYVADLAAEFEYPLVIVTRNVLGVINQTLQTLIVAATFRHGLPIAGIVLNHVAEPSAAASIDPSIHSNRDELIRRAVPPVLAEVRWGATGLDAGVDWMGLARGCAPGG
jgi:dethiobiotin synthetase